MNMVHGDDVDACVENDSKCYTCANVYVAGHRDNRVYCDCEDINLRHRCIKNTKVNSCKYYRPISINNRSMFQYAVT